MLRLFKSKTFVLGVIAALSAFSFLSFVFPQKAIYTEEEFAALEAKRPIFTRLLYALGFDDIFSSPLFLTLCALLAAGLIVYVADRGAKLFFPDYFSAAGGRDKTKTAEAGAGFVAGARQAGKRPLNAARLKLAGSILFHGGLLLLMGGALAGYLFGFSGLMAVTEGQKFQEADGAYLNFTEGPLFDKKHTRLNITLEKVERRYERGALTDIAYQFLFGEKGRVNRETIKTNYPVYRNGYSFMVQKNGFAPRFKIAIADGGEIFNGYVNIVSGGCGKEHFDVPGTDLRVHTLFAPKIKPAADGSNLAEFNAEKSNIQIKVLRKNPDGDKVLYFDKIRMNEAAQFEGGTLIFDDVRSWALLKVRKDPGERFVFLGFWLGIAGLALRFWGADRLDRAAVRKKKALPKIPAEGPVSPELAKTSPNAHNLPEKDGAPEAGGGKETEMPLVGSARD